MRMRGRSHRATSLGSPLVVLSLALIAGIVIGVVASVIVTARRDRIDRVAIVEAECTHGPVEVLAAPDIAPTLSELTRSFATQEEGLDADCAMIDIQAANPANFARRLARGQVGDTLPDVWIPDSSVWVNYVRASEEGRRHIPDESPSIARSPTIGGMLQPMAEALGWPGRQLGWAEVLPLISDPEVWSSRGHEEWGAFKMGFTDPAHSTVGMHSILSLGAAQDGVWIDELSSEGMSAPSVRLPLLQVERGIARQHRTTERQLARIRAADDRGDVLSYISALPIAERDVWRYNSGAIQTDGTTGAPAVPLVGIYPREGGLHFDYPYVELVGTGASRRTHATASQLRDFLRSEDVQRRLRAAGFRDRNNIPGDVLERADGLQPERAGGMAPPPAGKLVDAALDAWTTVSRRTNTLLVIDVSGSMQQPAPDGGGTRLARTVEAAQGALELAASDSDIGLWEFSTNLPDGAQGGDYRELVPIGPVDRELAGTKRRTLVRRQLEQLRPANDTALYDTVLASVRAVRATYQPGRLNEVVVLTDGRSDGDDLTLGELIAELRDEHDPQRPVRVLAIAYGDDADAKALRRIASVTDGRVFTPRSADDMPAVFLEVLTGS